MEVPNGSLVVRAAYLRICPHCERHASIVTADGTSGMKFWSKEAGRKILGEMLAKNELLPEEAEFLRSEINSSELEENDSCVENIFSVLRGLKAEEEELIKISALVN